MIPHNEEWVSVIEAEIARYKETNPEPETPRILSEYAYETYQDKMSDYISRYNKHIRKFTNDWFFQKGYIVIWPEDPRMPITVEPILNPEAPDEIIKP